MPTLPSLRCPGCGKAMEQITANVIPPANTYNDCLRRCPKCGIGATNAKNPAKVKFLQADPPQDSPPPKP